MDFVVEDGACRRRLGACRVVMIDERGRNRGFDDERRFARFKPLDRLLGGQNLVFDFGEFELLGLGLKRFERAFERIG